MGRTILRLSCFVLSMAMFLGIGTNTWAAEQTKNEIDDRCRIVFAEAGLEPEEGQVAVAAVINNREESELFPDDFYDIINQKGQFSSVKNGEIYNCGKPVDSEKLSPEIYIATRKVTIFQEDPTEALLWAEAERLGLDPEKYAAGGALYFYAPKACSEKALAERANIPVKVQIGNHIFYKVWE